jgi:hypothetical protein
MMDTRTGLSNILQDEVPGNRVEWEPLANPSNCLRVPTLANCQTAISRRRWRFTVWAALPFAQFT